MEDLYLKQVPFREKLIRGVTMRQALTLTILWLLGVPFGLIIILWLIGVGR